MQTALVPFTDRMVASLPLSKVPLYGNLLEPGSFQHGKYCAGGVWGFWAFLDPLNRAQLSPEVTNDRGRCTILSPFSPGAGLGCT